jgi:hypothetical protein
MTNDDEVGKWTQEKNALRHIIDGILGLPATAGTAGVEATGSRLPDLPSRFFATLLRDRIAPGTDPDRSFLALIPPHVFFNPH